MSIRSSLPVARRALHLTLASLVLGPAAVWSQQAKPALDHEDTYRWNQISQRALSADGAWLAYVIRPWDGDPTVVLARTDGSAEARFRGTSPVFTRDSRHVAFRVPPVEAVIDSLKMEDTPQDDLPGDSLAVVTLADAVGEAPGGIGVFRAGPIESFAVPEDGGAWVAYHLSGTPEEEEDEGEGEEAAEAEREAGGEEEGASEEPERSEAYERWHEKDEGTPLVLRDLEAGTEHRYEHVLAYEVAPSGAALAYAASTEDGQGDGLFVVDPATGGAAPAMTGQGHYRRLAFDEAGERLAFVANVADWDAERPAYGLYTATGGSWTAVLAVDGSTDGVPSGWWVSEFGDLEFSEDGSRLFFGTAPRAEPEPDPEVPEDERVRVDVWNWQDDYLQPMQLVRADDERQRSYLAVLADGRVTQLGSLAVPDVERAEDGAGDYALGSTDIPYRQELSWDGRYQDAWAIDLRTGDRRLVAERVRGFGGASLSPDAAWASWWDEEARDWKVAPLDGRSGPRSLTAEIPRAFFDELDDHPQGPPPYGGAMWTEGGAVLVVDRYDVWRTDPTGDETPVRLTAGREENVRYRVVRVSDGTSGGFGGGSDPVPDGEAVFHTFDLGTKAAGYVMARTDRMAEPEELIGGDYAYGRPVRARDAGIQMWTRESFVEFPDVWVGTLEFADARKLTDANPQQADYRWGTAELVSWLSADRIPLDGILIKPDGFDPARKYPLMVYFYERMSDGLHSYSSPVPNRASIRFPFYASRGYVVFVPDIPYEIGYPGESALDAVVPGVLALIDEGFIDEDRIGVQGHSWGGYQIAYMITKTDLFSAAEAGAPVSNMTSAYGGIRWGSGMSRMFQYERTQSRIGGTLWDERDRYIHNSPLFFADKIETPLLMMHNDEDGAVPWYQGIEMFVAMRRLAKPAFMLNYNGEPHGLTRRPNQEDWAIRMQQFFDHYLLDAPAPEWMAHGVPAVDKGRDLGLELIETSVSEEGEGGGG